MGWGECYEGKRKVDGGYDNFLPAIWLPDRTFAPVSLFQFIEEPGQLSRFREVPWWLFLAGAAGGLALFATTLLIGSLGPDKFFIASVAGQLIIFLLLSHFGWLGAEEDPINWRKVGGVLLAIGGVVLVNYSSD